MIFVLCVFCNIEPESNCGKRTSCSPVRHHRLMRHLLVVPKRHVETFFEATLEEMDAITRLIIEVKDKLDQQFHPDGYNIGVNVGSAAGQTIFHLHVHVIPRYSGDVPDPRGGIRRIKKSIVPYLEEGEE